MKTIFQLIEGDKSQKLEHDSFHSSLESIERYVERKWGHMPGFRTEKVRDKVTGSYGESTTDTIFSFETIRHAMIEDGDLRP